MTQHPVHVLLCLSRGLSKFWVWHFVTVAQLNTVPVLNGVAWICAGTHQRDRNGLGVDPGASADAERKGRIVCLERNFPTYIRPLCEHTFCHCLASFNSERSFRLGKYPLLPIDKTPYPLPGAPEGKTSVRGANDTFCFSSSSVIIYPGEGFSEFQALPGTASISYFTSQASCCSRCCPPTPPPNACLCYSWNIISNARTHPLRRTVKAFSDIYYYPFAGDGGKLILWGEGGPMENPPGK